MVSVAMATYNGEKYIKQQLESILKNLSECDEVVISDDGSTDSTKAIVESFHDMRLRWLEGPRKGIARNFGNAISACQGDVIFLSDQDDVWKENKVKMVLKAFEENDCVLIRHDAVVIDAEGAVLQPSYYAYRKIYAGIFRNWVRNTYQGCCMAFKAELKTKILPMPEIDSYHDWWIGLTAEKIGKTAYVSEKLIEYRRHGSNESPYDKHQPLFKMIKKRIRMAKLLLARRG